MDPFSYHNIFETKGVEYLIIIAFLVLLVPFVIVLNRKVDLRRKLQDFKGYLSSVAMNLPQGIFHSPGHTWAHLAKSGTAEIGVDSFIMNLTGDVRLTLLKREGEKISKGEKIAQIDHLGKKLFLQAPVSGEVLHINSIVEEESGKLQSDPYGEGWLLKVRPTDWKSETQSYHLAGEAVAWSGRELSRFRDFLAQKLPKYDPDSAAITLQDGGEIRENILADMPDGLWQDFQEEFLGKA